MLGSEQVVSTTPAVAQSKCAIWENPTGVQGSGGCEISVNSIFGIPARVTGTDGMNGVWLSAAVWGGLAWFLFMRGK